MSLIKPKEVKFTVPDEDGIETEYVYVIGKYNGLEGLDFIEYVAEIFKNGLNFNETRKGLLRECMVKMGKYIEAVTADGNKVSLANELILGAHLPNAEVAMQLMMAVHDYNTFFLKTANLSSQSHSIVTKASELITKIFAPLQASLSAKEEQL